MLQCLCVRCPMCICSCCHLSCVPYCCNPIRGGNAMLEFVVIMYSHCMEIQCCMSAAKPHAAARTISVFGKMAGGVPVEVVRVLWPPWAAALFVILFCACCPAGGQHVARCWISCGITVGGALCDACSAALVSLISYSIQ